MTLNLLQVPYPEFMPWFSHLLMVSSEGWDLAILNFLNPVPVEKTKTRIGLALNVHSCWVICHVSSFFLSKSITVPTSFRPVEPSDGMGWVAIFVAKKPHPLRSLPGSKAFTIKLYISIWLVAMMGFQIGFCMAFWSFRGRLGPIKRDIYTPRSTQYHGEISMSWNLYRMVMVLYTVPLSLSLCCVFFHQYLYFNQWWLSISWCQHPSAPRDWPSQTTPTCDGFTRMRKERGLQEALGRFHWCIPFAACYNATEDANVSEDPGKQVLYRGSMCFCMFLLRSRALGLYLVTLVFGREIIRCSDGRVWIELRHVACVFNYIKCQTVLQPSRSAYIHICIHLFASFNFR